MEPFQVTPEIIAGIAGALLSLVFSWVAGLNTKFAALPSETKRLIMAGLLLLTSAVIFTLNCYGIIQTQLTCSQNGIIQLFWMWVISITTNQGTYLLTPQTNSVKEIKAAQLILPKAAPKK
jgi:hypothetical protein